MISMKYLLILLLLLMFILTGCATPPKKWINAIHSQATFNPNTPAEDTSLELLEDLEDTSLEKIKADGT